MKIKVLIIDDEPLAINLLERFIANFKDYEIINKFSNPLLALEFLKNNQADVIFLDINLPYLSGMEMIPFITNQKVIVTTAFREYAADCYDLDVFDYLVKPIAFPRFVKSINKLNEELNYRNLKKNEQNNISTFIFVKVDKKMIKLFIHDILFIEGMKEYIKIVTHNLSYITHRTLNSILDELPANEFIRIHKSYIISSNKINSIQGNIIQLHDYKLPIGRLYSKNVKSLILKKDSTDVDI